ncbi:MULTISPECIES: caspase family protein [Leptolyngbya]|uniref:caspase family protein n=1 Tax=Leptolyngbya TaxID=47251 RepID=UPI00168544E1|nr:caspase family protein [Leptolyngbya sp. FACHB-1624]MBD1856721.1 caspase family protein [Leptolyngbya sp. FACHB-1624]
MTRRIYALLVGIDRYIHPVSPLQGCVNDVIAIEEYLRGRVNQKDCELHLQVLLDQAATRTAVIQGFAHHLAQARRDDIVLFYYSGHGSQEQAPPEFWHLEPDRLNETLVCWDSRSAESWDLADKELAKLIAMVAINQPQITIILDCCHSGSGTRDVFQETNVRQISPDPRSRPIESYFVSVAEAETLILRSTDSHLSAWNLPRGSHILLAACRDREFAKEYNGNGQRRGAFCFFLTETLRQTNGSLTYRDLFKRTASIVRSKVAAQTPQIEVTDAKDLDQLFLGGAVISHPPYFTIYFDLVYGWVIDGGRIHGIPPCSGHETTQLAVFSSEVAHLRDLRSAIGIAEVINVLPQLSQLKFQGISDLSPETTFKAVITSLPLMPLNVRLEGDEEGITFLRKALPSPYLREVSVLIETELELRVLARDQHYQVIRFIDDRAVSPPIPSYTVPSAIEVVRRLEHIARWTLLADLAPPTTSRIAPDAVKLEIYRSSDKADSQVRFTLNAAPQIYLEYQQDAQGKWQQPSMLVRLTNTSEEPLYCALLDLTDQYSIQVGFFEAGGIWLNPGQEAWALGKRPIYASVPQDLWQQGMTEFKDILKLIVSTAEFDAFLLAQDRLDRIEESRRNMKDEVYRPTPLNRLMQRVHYRDLSINVEPLEQNDDWMTDQITITTIRNAFHPTL